MKIDLVTPKQYSKYITNNLSKKVTASIETGVSKVKASELARKNDGLILYALEKAYEGEYTHQELTECFSLAYSTIERMFNDFMDTPTDDEKVQRKNRRDMDILNHVSWRIKDFDKSIESTAIKTLVTNFSGVDKVRKVCKKASTDTKHYSGTLMGHTDLETSLPLVVENVDKFDTTELYYLLTPARLVKDLLLGIITPVEMDEIISAIEVVTQDSQRHLRAYFSYRKLGQAVMVKPEIVRDATSGKQTLAKNLGTTLVHSVIKPGVATGQIGIHEDTLMSVARCIANYTGEDYSKLKKSLLQEMTAQGIEPYVTLRKRIQLGEAEQRKREEELTRTALGTSGIFIK